MSDDEVDTGGSGASLKTPIRGGEVKKGMCVFLKGKPCKAGDISISKTGKVSFFRAIDIDIDVDVDVDADAAPHHTGERHHQVSPPCPILEPIYSANI